MVARIVIQRVEKAISTLWIRILILRFPENTARAEGCQQRECSLFMK